MKARVSPVQSIEPHRILAPTRDLNREPLGPQSRVVTTILPLYTTATTERENFSILSDVYRDLTLLAICINIRPLGYIMTFNYKITLVRFVDIIASCIVVIVV